MKLKTHQEFSGHTHDVHFPLFLFHEDLCETSEERNEERLLFLELLNESMKNRIRLISHSADK